VFNIPGVARYLVEAIRWRDYPIVQNILVMCHRRDRRPRQFHRRHDLRALDRASATPTTGVSMAAVDVE